MNCASIEATLTATSLDDCNLAVNRNRYCFTHFAWDDTNFVCNCCDEGDSFLNDASFNVYAKEYKGFDSLLNPHSFYLSKSEPMTCGKLNLTPS